MGSPGTVAPWRPAWWFWLLGAPATVVTSLLWTHNILVVFALYQLGICVILPAMYNMALRDLSLKEHLKYLGLAGPGGVRIFVMCLSLGAFISLAILAAFHFFGDVFLAAHDVPGTLAVWGVTRANLPLVFWFMTLVSGPAEEIYWRGFVQSELVPSGQVWHRVLLISACYASYHGLTVYLLVADLPVALLFMAAIASAGFFWGWLRQKTGSVWPALVSHAAAAGAYMMVARSLLDF